MINNHLGRSAGEGDQKPVEISILASRSGFLYTNLPRFQSLFCPQPISFYTSLFPLPHLINLGLPWFILAATD